NRKLSAEEFKEMQLHTEKGDITVSMIPDLHPIRPIVRNHHERWDGSGYPDRLKADGIPLMARIVSVVDAYDAMTTNRPYRAARSVDAAFEELRKMATPGPKGEQQFDATCVAAFEAIREQVVEAMMADSETAVVAI